MTLNPESLASGHTLIQRLDEYNPWWGTGKSDLTAELPSPQNAFYRSYSALHESEQRLIPITGPDGAGKSLLLNQLISAHIDSNFVEKFFPNSTQRENAQENIIPSSNVLYVPLRDDPVFQLRPEEQLREAVDHFETHVLRQHESPAHYLFFDDLNVVERPNKRGNQDVGRWERLLLELLGEHEARHIVFTGLSREAMRERLASASSEASKQAISSEQIDSYPPGFADFLRMRYRDVELAPLSLIHI